MSTHSETHSRDTLEPWGRALHLPEGVPGTPSGDVYVSDWRGGVTVIRADGSQHRWLARRPDGFELRPDGVALAPDGSFLLANPGNEGGVWRLGHDSALIPFLMEVSCECTKKGEWRQ